MTFFKKDLMVKSDLVKSFLKGFSYYKDDARLQLREICRQRWAITPARLCVIGAERLLPVKRPAAERASGRGVMAPLPRLVCGRTWELAVVYRRHRCAQNAHGDGECHFKVVNNKKLSRADLILQLPENVVLHFNTMWWLEIDFFFKSN